MKKGKCSEEQIATALRQVDAGAPVPEVTRTLWISEAVLGRAKTLRSAGRGRDQVVAAARR